MRYVIIGDAGPLFIRSKSEPLVYHRSQGIKIDYQRQLEEQMSETLPLSGPLHLDIEFHLAMPTNITVKKRKELEGKLHTSGTKISYLLHFLEFLKQNKFYNDDCSIASMHIVKRYSENPRTSFSLKEIA